MRPDDRRAASGDPTPGRVAMRPAVGGGGGSRRAAASDGRRLPAHRPVRTGWPVGRVLSPGFLRRPVGDHPSRTTVAGGLVRSTRELGRAALERSLSDLAPGGVCLATTVTRRAGGFLHHRFTLTAGKPEAVCFLWHFPASHLGWPLATTLPCGARTFLGGVTPNAVARPAHPRKQDSVARTWVQAPHVPQMPSLRNNQEMTGV